MWTRRVRKIPTMLSITLVGRGGVEIREGFVMLRVHDEEFYHNNEYKDISIIERV